MRKFLTFFLTALLAFGVGWAGEVTVTKTVNQLRDELGWRISSGTEINGMYTNFNLDENITISTSGGPNCGSVWAITSSSSTYQWRLYQAQGGDITISANNDCTLKSITLTFAVSNNGYLDGVTSGTPIEVNGTSVTYTVGATSGTKGQVRITEFSVTYEVPEAPQPTANNYVKVTSADQIVTGKKYILVAGGYAMGTPASGSTAPGIAVNVNNNTVDIAGTAVAEFELGSGTYGYTLMLNGSYLGCSGNGKFATSASAGRDYSWTFNLVNESYTVKCASSDYKYNIRLNGTNFAPYSSTSYTNAQLYVQEETVAPVTPPSLSANPTSLTIGEGGGSFNVTGENLIDNVGVELTNGDVFTRSLSSSTNEFRNNENGNWYFIKDNDGELNGTVAVVYNGRDLTATSTVTMGTNKLDSDEDEVAQVTVTYQPDIYIYGDFGSGWNYLNDGQMAYNDGVYSKTITADQTVYLMFARKTGESYGWNDNRYFFSVKKSENGNWVFGTDGGNELEMSTSGQYHPIQLPAGVYTITINAAAKTFAIASTSVSNIAQAQAKPVDDTFTFMGSAVVTYQSGNNLWIRDSSGSGLINGSVGVTFENGEILAPGWSAKNTMYNTYVPRFTNPANVAKGEGTAAAAPIPLTELTTEDMNKYVSLSNVTVTDVDSRNYTVTMIGDKQAHLYDYFQLFTQNPLVEGNKYNVEGVVTFYDGAPELYLTKVEDITPMYVTLESETTTATAGNEIPVTVNVVNAVGDYTISYKIGESGTPTTLTDGNVINVTSETAGEVTLYVTVTSNDNEATAQKTFTFTEPVQPGSNVFKLLTDNSQLQEGKRVIIAGSKLPGDDRSAMGEQQNNNFKSTPVTITNDLTIEATEATQILTLEGETGAWYFKAENNEYLYAASSSDNHLKTQATKTDNAKATIVINSSGGNTQVTFQGDHTHKYLRYNSTNELFSCYLSGKQENIYLYVETASAPEPMTISLTAAPEEAYTVGDNVTVTATVENGSENTVITYKINNGDEQTYAAPGIVLPNTAAGDVVVTVKATDGNNVATDTVTYHFNAAEAFAITLTATPAQETYEVGSTVNVKVNVENVIGENLTITYTIGETRANETYDPATGINITSATADTVPLTVNVVDGYQHAGESTVTASYVFVKKTMGLAFEPTSTQAYVGQDVTEPELKNLPEGLTVAYSSSNATVASVDAEGNVTAAAAGEAIITAKFAGNDVYEADSASYTITVLAKKAAGLSYGDEAVVFNVKVGDNIEEPTLANPNSLSVTYESSDTTVAKVDNLGNVSIVGAGTAVITAKSEATTEYLAGEASYTINVTKKDLEASLEGDTELVFTLGDEFTVPTLKGVPEDLNVTYESNDTTVAKVDAEGNVTIVGPGEATITITVEGNDMYNGTTLTYTIKVNDVVENIQTLTFYPASGTYTEAKNVAIACATPGVNIEYKIGDGEWQTYNAPFTVAQSCTVTAKATKGTRTVWVDSEATATYTINAKAPVQIANGYYNLKSNGINQYANIQGRRTLTFTNDIDKQAGTVLQVETDANGQVKTLRSQGVDMQGYAKRAMAYVPTIVQMVVDKLNAEGEGNLLGENGLDAIKAKFDECFDYHLYVEGSEGAYRIYGRTPSMQPVVDFYAENKDKVDAKLPQLEEFIQSAIVKLRNKANGAGYDGTTVFEDFTLHKIWKRMGSNLIEPVDDASKMAFYQQVLTNKQYVWDFAYQTAMLYINNVKESETYKNLAAENEDLDLLVNKMTSIRPETKYFIIENGNELDYVSENHTYIINDNAQTYWSLSPREDFTVTFPEENKVNDSYYTTLYTDFAYNVPEDVTAYAVTGIDGNNLADLTAFTGTIPAQTPVLLMTKDNGAKAVTKALELTTETGTVPEGNLLVGPDYLINEYKLTSPTVEGLFNMAQAILKQDLYNEYVKPYEYLMLKTAGTVNNKYFWGLTQADVEKCVAGEDNDCVIRNLVGDEFVNNWTAPKNNEAFLVSADKDVIYLSLEPAEAPTFSPVPGSYTSNDPIDVTITGPAGATIEYSTDGGNAWETYNDTPISVNGEVTILARTKATQSGTSESETVKGYYIIDKPDELPTMDPFDGYYSVKNNGNEKYVNVAGRKTITFAREADIDKMAGTVIYLKTDEHGQVQSLRSQAADLQGYADKAMRYVPEIVQMAVDKLHAEGEGNLLGETGLDSIMAKFNKCFDHHLYVEPADGGYRLYGKTPNMQHVVDFYRDHKDKVEAKLPQLETFINSAITKVLEKTGGRGASILKPFSLLQTWQRMDSALVDADLIKPVDEATTMDFYRQVLNNKKYVWAFAYETAMTYWERLKANQTFQNNIDKLGEFAQYIDKIEDVHPDFKYYIVQDNDKPDYISEGNIDIKNNVARTIWTLDPRTTFSVNFADDMTMDERLYYTTLYTDFAYSMPEGVKAYKVTEVNKNGVGAIEALEGTIPAQTPVLLKANAAGDVELTIAAAGDADVTGNLLVGADYFINEYQINTPQVEGLFEMVASIFGENSTFYQELLTKYGHLMLKTSGTVNNKYFWALTNDDLNQCVAGEDNDCVIRKLNKGEDGIGFYSEWSAPANQAFLSNSEFNPVKLLLGKDVTRDGLWNVADVTATISIILETAPEGNNYDYDAADFDNNGRINVADVTAMIAYILGKVN